MVLWNSSKASTILRSLIFLTVTEGEDMITLLSMFQQNQLEDAAKTATEQIMDIRQTLRYLGSPITTKSFLFGDNRSVVTSAN